MLTEAQVAALKKAKTEKEVPQGVRERASGPLRRNLVSMNQYYETASTTQASHSFFEIEHSAPIRRVSVSSSHR